MKAHNIQDQLSNRVNNMKESSTLAMSRMARELKSQGKDVISLSLGEPDFDTPEYIKDAAKKALDEGYTKYTPVNGYLELREAIVHKFKRDNGLTYTADQIVVSTGAKQALANLFLALLNPGDEAVVLAPGWVSYFDQISFVGAKAVVIETDVENDYKITPQQLEDAITEKTKCLIFSSPCNPSGMVYSREDLEGFAEVLRKHPNIIVIADEIYELINFGDEHVSFASLPGMQERSVTVNGFSKGFAMTGWRLGYIGAPTWIAAACSKIQGQFTSGTNAFAQRAAITALTVDAEESRKMKSAFLKRRDLVIELLNKIPGFKCPTPEGAFYVFPDVSALFGKSNGTTTINNAHDLSLYLLQEALVATVGGGGFKSEDCLRLSFATSEEKLTEALTRIKTAIEKLS